MVFSLYMMGIRMGETLDKKDWHAVCKVVMWTFLNTISSKSH